MSRASLDRLSQRSQLPHAREVFMGALERARASWPSVADACPARMRLAMGELWGAVPVLREIGAL